MFARSEPSQAALLERFFLELIPTILPEDVVAASDHIRVNSEEPETGPSGKNCRSFL